jgi:hypothetical protein
MSKEALIIFMKNPVKGKVKTRLAVDIGEDASLEVYHQLLARSRAVTSKIDAKRFLYYSDRIEDDEWPTALFKKRVQQGSDLGERMSEATQRIFEEDGIEKLILIGSDCYQLTEKHIQNAFDALRYADLVIGPANDGGYYLIGMNANYNDLFHNIPWSSEQVLRVTLSTAEQLKLSYVLLEELIDLDTFDDLKKSSFPYLPK